jgi:hypothetical protein
LLEAAEAVLVRHNLWVNSLKAKINPPLPETLEAFAELKSAIDDIKNAQ